MTATPETANGAVDDSALDAASDTTAQWGLTPEQAAIRALAREVSER